MTCTCKQFDLKKLPCVHAVKAACVIGVDKYYDCCSVFYNSAFWKHAYEESIYHVSSQVDWEIPEDVIRVTVLPPDLKEYRKRGRPRTNRYRSQSKLPKKKPKCTNCGEAGHSHERCPQSVPATSRGETRVDLSQQ